MNNSESVESTIRKLEKSLASMREKGANTKVVETRLQAHYVALTALKGDTTGISAEELRAAQQTLQALMPSLEKTYAKLKAGSPQHTLLERRIEATKRAIDNITDLLEV